MIRRVLKRIVPKTVKSKISKLLYSDTFKYARLSYSQEGEDLILERIFRGKNAGYFVDVGAHHPRRLSNTYFFYKKGWRGINIDPMPGILAKFSEDRPNDTNIEVGVSDVNGVLEYYIFDEPALNTFDNKEAEYKDSLDECRIIDRQQIEVKRLDEILDRYLDENQQIDFMNIDVEGLDLKVLKSNNWTKYRPRVVLVEELRSYLDEIFDCETHKFLVENNYRLYAKSHNTLFYLEKEFTP